MLVVNNQKYTFFLSLVLKVPAISNYLFCRSIEDDVLENQEDIIDLRVTDSHHDVLISQGTLFV